MRPFAGMIPCVLACVTIMGMSLAHEAEGAILVKPRSDVSQSEPAEEKAVGPDAPKVTELAVNVSLRFDKISKLLNQFEFRFQSQGTAAAFISYKGTLT